jgi:hypothetical protein
MRFAVESRVSVELFSSGHAGIGQCDPASPRNALIVPKMPELYLDIQSKAFSDAEGRPPERHRRRGSMPLNPRSFRKYFGSQCLQPRRLLGRRRIMKHIPRMLQLQIETEKLLVQIAPKRFRIRCHGQQVPSRPQHLRQGFFVLCHYVRRRFDRNHCGAFPSAKLLANFYPILDLMLCRIQNPLYDRNIAFALCEAFHALSLAQSCYEVTLKKMVGATGFEPATSWSQTKCSTRLSYAPNPKERHYLISLIRSK